MIDFDYKVQKNCRTLCEITQDHIKELIRTKKFAPGSKLLPEPELSKILGISRTTLRTAISSLEKQGLVNRRKGHGTFITKIDRALLDNYVEARLMIETYVGKKVINRGISEGEAKGWKKLADKLKRIRNQNELIKYQPEFHLYLIRMAGNKYLEKVYTDLLDNLQVMQLFYFDVVKRKEIIYKEHLGLYTQVCERNTRLFEILIEKHIMDAKQKMLDSLGALVS